MEKDFIVTQEGLQKLKDELNDRKTVQRKKIADRIKVARDFGDISENSEYDDAKNEQAFNEGRIQELDDKIRRAVIIEDANDETAKSGAVVIGSVVSVLDVELNEKETYRIVGTIEADPMKNRISNESPVGAALLGHKTGDTIKVQTPAGQLVYEILEVKSNGGSA